ncbi:phospholipid-binding protein [Cavenderia fasciculata]|uniref:Copine-3 n=1 Tax=Cavenderia fasciculata TaxID=261658 RepID=F4Q1S6_CACFS|nr:phospholipid-binding protein [Cavenderia fasciculata]EGG18226.1 phospholipid-binding protein [Cavenderia fasciculata]|eukprot:XP_004357049.1 phospholipid-binding protein [Cavenderia fasciculata]
MTTVVPTSKIELRFKCSRLANLDMLSLSDPILAVYQQDRAAKWVKVGTTEKIDNNLNPQFKTPVMVDYFFEEVQNLKFTVYDVDNDKALESQDYIGSAITTLGAILSKPGLTLVLPLTNQKGRPAGSVQVTAEEIDQRSSGQNFRVQVQGNGLDKKDFFGKSDPYFFISKMTPSGFAKVYESPVKKNTLDPVYSQIDIPISTLNGGDMTRQIRFDFYDWDKVGSHDYIGNFVTSVDEILRGTTKFDLINEEKKKKKGSKYTNSGVILLYAKLVRDYQFLEYIVGGCEISLIVGIDCTASNKPPSDPTSLHFKHPTEPNQYAKAIVSIGNVLAPYDYDGLIPTYGFGGIVPGQSRVNHCFPMSLNDATVCAQGVGGILDMYYNNIGRVQLHGPTYFAPIINQVAQTAAQGSNQQTQKYTILLIITDGEILDMENTVEAICKASVLPLSIVIIGVGNADFSNMVKLDGDDGLLVSTTGLRAERDIVQFVALRDSLGGPHLAAETLREIPGQLTSFFKKYNIHPNPPRHFVESPSQQQMMAQGAPIVVGPGPGQFPPQQPGPGQYPTPPQENPHAPVSLEKRP